MTQRSPLVSPRFAGSNGAADQRQLILGYRNANHTRPIPKATTPAPPSISTALCGPESNPVPCPNQKSPTAIHSGPTTIRMIFMRACLDRAIPQRVEKVAVAGRRFSKRTRHWRRAESGRKRQQCRSIRGRVMWRNSHIERGKLFGAPGTKRGGPLVSPVLLPGRTTGAREKQVS
jgi:hypothetical protein